MPVLKSPAWAMPPAASAATARIVLIFIFIAQPPWRDMT
jgi:hypothetical protein